MTDREIKSRVLAQFNKALGAHRNIRELLVGRSAKIISDYNGQPYGRSAPSMRGRIKSIVAVHFDLNQGVSVQLTGSRLYISIDEIEIV